MPPIAAVREGATLPPSRFAAHAFKVGLGVVGVAVAALAAGMFAAGSSTVGVVALLGGGVLGAVRRHGAGRAAPGRAAGPVRRRCRRARVGGVAGELAGANAVRNPGRTASTAAALMIGSRS